MILEAEYDHKNCQINSLLFRGFNLCTSLPREGSLPIKTQCNLVINGSLELSCAFRGERHLKPGHCMCNNNRKHCLQFYLKKLATFSDKEYATLLASSVKVVAFCHPNMGDFYINVPSGLIQIEQHSYGKSCMLVQYLALDTGEEQRERERQQEAINVMIAKKTTVFCPLGGCITDGF